MEHGAGGASVFPNFLLVQLTISMSATSRCLCTKQQSPSSWQVSLDKKGPVQLHHGWFANVNEKMVTGSQTSIKSIMVKWMLFNRQFHMQDCDPIRLACKCYQKKIACLLGCAHFYIYKGVFLFSTHNIVWFIIYFKICFFLMSMLMTHGFSCLFHQMTVVLFHSSACFVNISTWWEEKNNSFSTSSPSAWDLLTSFFYGTKILQFKLLYSF